MNLYESDVMSLNNDFEWTAQDHLKIQNFKNFKLESLEIHSQVLKKTPWGTKAERFHPLLVPKTKAPKQGWPVVWWLAGFTGNGTKQLGFKGFETNMAEDLDRWVSEKSVPPCILVFVDAWTPWGGSQFINSKSMGAMEDHLMTELLPALHAAYSVDRSHKKWTVAGGSSGGFGALHLASEFPEIFPQLAAVAPDSFFKMSLLPEILLALPQIKRMGGVGKAYELLSKGKFFRQKNAHSVLNALAMGLCYAPTSNGRDIQWPIHPRTGIVDTKKWKKFEDWDPIHFLQKRKLRTKKIRRAFLAAGSFDQFHLQYGTAQIADVLKKLGVKTKYVEFEGDHFDLHTQRKSIFEWI